jgi:hypothetical protein
VKRDKQEAKIILLETPTHPLAAASVFSINRSLKGRLVRAYEVHGVCQREKNVSY